jgi:Domain of unknown function (DUF4345)
VVAPWYGPEAPERETYVSLTRLFLLATGLLSVAIGLAYLIAPVPLASVAALDLSSPLAVIEVRGFYGGQLIGLGAFILLGIWRSAFVVPALLLIAASLGGTALGRIVGVLASGSLPPAIVGVLVLELLATVAALFLWDRERRTRPA